ncbi:hypothetical protein PsorP6_011804 [Peronosclerospora sorghi]|uniref:Uncharacterized protein n=1 Tax=Peronosclerospora sorghi TaxID=230839 RepID=A0ACC0WIS9_9STRA|nr:hypothetical protein PsorP6_011804 [Peronosclerospora sorghi]
MAPQSGQSQRPNYYYILGVERAASTDDIKAAYRKLVKSNIGLCLLYSVLTKNCQALPDEKMEIWENLHLWIHHIYILRQQDAEIMRINAAYDLLSDDEARVKYDLEMFGHS